MSRRNHLFAVVMLGVALCADRAIASDTPSNPSATNRPAFEASLRGGETVGDHQIQRVFLDIGTNQIAFIVPGGFRMDASDSQKIVLSDNTGENFITVRVSNLKQPDAASQSKVFRADALRRFPGAKISDETSENAAGHSGSAFNLEWASPGGTAESARIAFIPCPAGVLEFSVLAPTAKFKDAQLYLTLLMTSVRSNETGKLVIVPLPDFS